MMPQPSRDRGKVGLRLAAVERAARGSENLMPPILAAVEGQATLGEISDALRRVYGAYEPRA